MGQLKNLTIAISSYGDRITKLQMWDFDPRVEYLVVWQPGPSRLESIALPSHVHLIALDSVGVAGSRNHALAVCNTEWIWFMDDDVDIPKSSVDYLLNRLSECKSTDILVGAVDFGSGGRFKRFEKSTRSVYSVFGIGTIQIVCNSQLARREECAFPTNMGAGSRFPLCDEPIFIARMIRKAGARLIGVPEVQVRHPSVSSGSNFTEAGHLVSRAMLFREIFGFPFCVIASVLFFLKHAAKIKWRFPLLFLYFRPA